MSVKLFPHNETAYRNAAAMLEKQGKAAVIHPTGTGKSFIAFRLAEDHPNARICWLAPSEYIFRSQKENYLEAGGDKEILERITFITYSKLMYDTAEYGREVFAGASGYSGKIFADTEEHDIGVFAGMPERDMGVFADTSDWGTKVISGTAGQDAEFFADIGDAEQTGNEIKTPPDYIILDEFHRCGAESWGKGVDTLLETFPNAKVLGLSATHIRYLDSRRDMARELFGGNIASKMELAEAIARGILPAPAYICCFYKYEDELRKMSLRVQNQRNAKVQDESKKVLDKLRHCLTQADGPREIFARYMKKDGKYIVFCSSREHMEETISLAGHWFGSLDREPSIYRAIYDNSDSPEEVKEFQRNKSSHLKLLFCIDMLNEGIHVADVDGAVLLRPTASPVLYLQQVGRALSVPDKETGSQPMIFDMVDNFDSLRCIDSFLEEYRRECASDARVETRKEEPRYQFRLIDEARDSRILFEKLCRCLSSSWDACFQEAETYYKKYGNLKIPKSYITENGIALGSWLLTQRRVRWGTVPGNLSREQIARLNAIGMDWEGRTGKAWENGYQELVDFYEKHGHSDVPSRYVTEEGYPLGRFVSNQRQAWKNGQRIEERGIPTGRTLTAERKRKLDAVDFIWEKTEQNWERYYGAAKTFYEREGHLEVPAKYVTEDGLRLGEWIRAKAADRSSVSEEKAKELEAIGLSWGSRYDAKWEEKYRLAKQFYQQHGHLEVPKDYVIEGVRLGRWINALRSARKDFGSSHYRLDAERIRQLDAIGMRWDNESWETRFRLAKQYYQEHGNLNISQTYVVSAGDGKRIWLGKWLAQQRKKHNQTGVRHALTKEQTERLDGIGMKW